MSKLLKKILKTSPEFLEATETVVSAIAVTPPGQVMAQGVGGLAGVAINHKIQKNRAEKAGAEVVDGMGSTVPTKNVYLGISSSGDLLVLEKSAMSGKVTGLGMRIPRSDLDGFEAEKKKLIGKFTLRFKDGSIFQCDVPMSVGLKDFADGLQRVGIFGEMT